MRVRAGTGPPGEAGAMRRLLACTLAPGACALALGCGGDDADTADRGERPATPFITLAEAEDVIERGALAVVRTGGADAPAVAGAGLVDAARTTTRSSRGD